MCPYREPVSGRHYQRMGLSPVSAIAGMVTPVALITMAAVLANELAAIISALTGDVLALERERPGILHG